MEKYQVEFSAMAAPFAMVYGPVVVDKRLNDAAVRLYTLLWILGDRMKEGWHSQKLLANLLNVTDRTIRNSLKTLSDTGLITTTVRRPRPTLIRIEDPHSVYGAEMQEFYGLVRERSRELRRGESHTAEKESNRKNSSDSIGKNLPMKKIKEEDPMKGAGKSPRTSPEESFDRIVNSSRSPAQKRTLKIPQIKPQSPSRWGGEKFYLYALSLAEYFHVRVRDERNLHASRVPPRYAREMKWAMNAFDGKGLGPRAFAELLKLIFEHWDTFHRHFPRDAFSVYDLRYSASAILKTARNLEGKTSLADLEDIKEKPKPAKRRAPEFDFEEGEK